MIVYVAVTRIYHNLERGTSCNGKSGIKELSMVESSISLNVKCTRDNMKLLLILALATLAMSQEAFDTHKVAESNDVPQGTTVLQIQPDSGVQTGDKKLDKRSHGWGGWGGHGHGYGWPSYSIGWGHGGHGHYGHGHYGGGWGGWGGHGWYGGWPWPWWYGSSGWHGGWHGGHGGWHSKW